VTLHIGDCRDTMRRLIADGVKVQTCVTSPPYWGLRAYLADDHADKRHELGLEATPELYVKKMVQVFRLMRELLVDTGTCWVNFGDSFSDKQLQGIPWKVAFALQADGWWLRSDIIWHKPNPMPESCTDRPTKSHEYIFLLSKRASYFYDAAAIAEKSVYPGDNRAERTDTRKAIDLMCLDGGSRARTGNPTGEFRNKRTVWTVATAQCRGGHFATFPPKLIEPCILAGTSQRGHCPECGKGWERDVEIESRPNGGIGKHRTVSGGVSNDARTRIDNGCWKPGCACGLDPVPGIVLDPFMGSGTVGQVCESLGRRWIGCELSAEYGKLSDQRTAQQGLVLA
jgi:site-specific DNA-methyltransferase (cytosine-N4-specific)